MNKKILFALVAVISLFLTFSLIFAHEANKPKLTPQEQTFIFLRKNGLSDEQACGIMACIEITSNFNPEAEDMFNTGYGLLMWSSKRKSSLEKFANTHGKPMNDFELQLEFLLNELQPYSENYQLIPYNGYTPSDFWSATTPEDAAISFCSTFERPHVNFINHSESDRIMIANEFYKTYCN